jgi:competence protein ComEA
VGWFGVGRLVASAVSVVVVCAGAVWLVRSPSPPTEASLPFTDTASTPDATLVASSPPAPAAPSTVPVRPVVHVAGAVRAPGVYELAPGARIREAIEAAGGPTATAAAHELNLAEPLLDGSRIHVPAEGEEVVGPLVDAPSGGGDDLGSTDPAAPVDLNRATTDELETLPGVGPATATAIVEDRARNGPFAVVEDLDRVPGIGPAKLEALRDLVTT